MRFLDEYLELCHSAKIELLQNRLIVGESDNHTRHLFQQILRGWGLEVAIVLAPGFLWRSALTQAFGCPDTDDLDHLKHWADTFNYDPTLLPYTPGNCSWQNGLWKQTLTMAMFGLDHEEKLGRHTSRGVINRLGNDALMPDNYFYLGTPEQTLYEYYLQGPAQWVVEWVRPGVENHVRINKRSRYEAAGVPELTILDAKHQTVEFLRLIDGRYQPQQVDASGRYALSSIPGLTFLTENLWLTKDDDKLTHPLGKHFFEIVEDTPRIADRRPCSVGAGMDFHDRPVFPISLDPVAIPFEDFAYWTPESKFEFVDGKPDIGGIDGVKGLTGMMLMTFGLTEAVKLFHPKDWVQALLNLRSFAKMPMQEKPEWKQACEIAIFLKDQYGSTRVAVSGDLVHLETLTAWSRFVIIAWGLPQGKSDPNFLNPYSALYQMNPDYRIHLVYGEQPDDETEEAWIRTAIDL